MPTGKTIALARWTFVGKVTYLLFNMISLLIITFLLRSKCLLISWLHSQSGSWSGCLNNSYIQSESTEGRLVVSLVKKWQKTFSGDVCSGIVLCLLPASRHDLRVHRGLSGGSAVKNLSANAGDVGSILDPEGSTCCGATKPMCHNYRAGALVAEATTTETTCCNYRSLGTLEPIHLNKGSHHSQKPTGYN